MLNPDFEELVDRKVKASLDQNVYARQRFPWMQTIIAGTVVGLIVAAVSGFMAGTFARPINSSDRNACGSLHLVEGGVEK